MIFVGNKPIGISSNAYLSKLKRKYKQKSMGYSGTLDPFAGGVLIVASKEHSKLFRFLKTEPKIYQATIFLGAKSKTLDDEDITSVDEIKKLSIDEINKALKNMQGNLEFIPPQYSAKHIDGKRAYELARSGIKFELEKQTMQVFFAEFLHYKHPFLTIKLGISKGGYARSFAELFCQKFEINGTLSALYRLSEGDFVYENEKLLDAFLVLDLKQNEFLGDIEDVKNGKKLQKSHFKNKENGIYKVRFDDFFSIFEIDEENVKYILNKVDLC